MTTMMRTDYKMNAGVENRPTQAPLAPGTYRDNDGDDTDGNTEDDKTITTTIYYYSKMKTDRSLKSGSGFFSFLFSSKV